MRNRDQNTKMKISIYVILRSINTDTTLHKHGDTSFFKNLGHDMAKKNLLKYTLLEIYIPKENSK